MKSCVLALLILLLFGGGRVFAQKVAVKTNVLYWATTTPNLGFEFGLGKKTSLEFFGGYNPWNLDKGENKKMKHYLIQPEFRYWLCERFQGHFFGLHAGFSEYNVSGVRLPLPQFPKRMKDHRYEGWGCCSVSLTVTPGYWGGVGTWRPRSVAVTSTVNTTFTIA